MAADGHLNFDTEIDEKGFNSGIKKLSGLAKVLRLDLLLQRLEQLQRRHWTLWLA